ncbi:4'-phosphopantetheinyl transferase family protein [Streptomyces yanii]|uniref:4'-phosphopantetheinyl transferase n=1 Tax=Streptomyces yanii TaxID=78510 RepID=A0ABV5R4G4_9ACTN
MIDAPALFPAAVVHAELFHDPSDQRLFPGEEALVANAVEARRREFTSVRACARTALVRLGHPPVPILKGPHGAPSWPTGVVGSLTHCRGYRAAAVADRTEVASVGLDAEPNEALPDPGILPLIALPQERDRLADLALRRSDICWERLLFSAKESVYKTWYPLTGRWLDFEQAEITIHPDTGTFHARLLVPGPVVDGTRLDHFHGTWQARHGVLLTAVTVPARQQET